MYRLLTLAAAAASVFLLSGIGVDAAENGHPGAPAASPPAAAAAAPSAADPSPAAAEPSGGSASEISASGHPIALEVGKGVLIRLPHAAGTVFIANPDIADVNVKSPSLIYLTAKSPGETALYAVDAQDHVLLNSPIRVGPNMTQLRQKLNAIDPGGAVKAEPVENSIVLSGSVPSAARAERLRTLAAAAVYDPKNPGSVIDRMSIATPNQVNLRVKVAEVDRTALKSIGVNWEKLTSTGSTQFLTGNPVINNDITARDTFEFTFGGPMSRISTILDALAQEGLVKTLAEPNLTCISGYPASFLAGGQFYIPTVQQTAAGTVSPFITATPQNFGVQLQFTPTVIDANHLTLTVRPEVSALSTVGEITENGTTLPGLQVRRAETTVELASGQSFALAGLLQNNVIENASKIPGLANIPILGQLFRSEQFERDQSELVIIVTAYLVKPSNTNLPTPVDAFEAPHDAQRVISGDMYRQKLPGPASGPVGSDGQGLIGPAGFRMN